MIYCPRYNKENRLDDEIIQVIVVLRRTVGVGGSD